MISVKIIEDSISKYGDRLTTFEYTAPRYILSQINTHRVLSKNAGSSRAIPVTKNINKVSDTPVIPIWNRNKPGMQGDFDVTGEEAAAWEIMWLEARDDAVKHAIRLRDAGAHKQIVNRILEPYIYFKGVISGTEWDNFFNLRIGDAQPEIDILARQMQNCLQYSIPKLLTNNQWHIPYITAEEKQLPIKVQIKISVARCARTSYKTFDTNTLSTIEKDLELYESLLNDKHLSPFEHQAKPDIYWTGNTGDYPVGYQKPEFHGNYKGWLQNRKYVECL